MPLVSAHSQCPLSVFECADPMRNIHIFKLWSNYSKISLLFYVFWTFTYKAKRSVSFAYNSSNLDHWISQLQVFVVINSFQGFSVDGALHSISFFLEQGLLIDDLKAATILSHARQPEVDFLLS